MNLVCSIFLFFMFVVGSFAQLASNTVILGAGTTNPLSASYASVVSVLAESNRTDQLKTPKFVTTEETSLLSNEQIIDNDTLVSENNTLHLNRRFDENDALMSFSIAELLGSSVYGMIQGRTTMFTDQAGVDTAASSNEVYDSGGDYYTDVSGTAPPDGVGIHFDGINDNVALGVNAAFNFGSAFSFAGWAYLDEAPNSSGIFLLSDEATGSQGVRVTAGGNLAVDLLPIVASIQDTGIPMARDAWYHIVLAYSDATGSMDLYTNGVNAWSVAGSGALANFSAYVMYIGCGYSGNCPWPGKIDELAFWNRRLTTNEILTLYNSGSGMLANNSTNPWNDGLVYASHFDENTGVATEDVSLNKIAGTLQSGASWVASPVCRRSGPGSMLKFDGSDDHLEDTDTYLPSGTNARTVVCWVKLDNVSGLKAIFHYGTSAGYSEFLVSFNDANCQVSCYNDNTIVGVFTPNVWYNLAVVFESAVAVVYTNGAYCGGIGTAFSANTILNGSAQISKYPDGRYLAGQLDELLVFDRAVTSNELVAIYDVGVGAYGNISTNPWNSGLVLGLHFDEGTGTTADDFSPTLASWSFDSTSPTWITGYKALAPAGNVIANMGLISTNIPFLSTPTTIRMVVEQQDIGVAQTNVDAKYWASRNDGTNWEQVWLSPILPLQANGHLLLSGLTTNIGLHTATDNIRWRITTPGLIEQRFYKVNIGGN